jgi:hypothetical protein
MTDRAPKPWEQHGDLPWLGEVGPKDDDTAPWRGVEHHPGAGEPDDEDDEEEDWEDLERLAGPEYWLLKQFLKDRDRPNPE